MPTTTWILKAGLAVLGLITGLSGAAPTGEFTPLRPTSDRGSADATEVGDPNTRTLPTLTLPTLALPTLALPTRTLAAVDRDAVDRAAQKLSAPNQEPLDLQEAEHPDSDHWMGEGGSTELMAGNVAGGPPGARDPVLWKKALEIHRRAIIIDGHNDITSAILDDGYDLAKPTGPAHTDLARMKAGGISGEFFSIYVSASFWEKPDPYRGGASRRAMDMIDITYQQIERHPQDLALATSPEEIRSAKKEGRIAILMGIEGGHAIENSLHTLRSFFRLGIRYMTLTHSNTNDWADASGIFEGARSRHGGLNAFGEEVVREMQRIGMLVDVSHVSDETFYDVMRVAKAPVIASHSSARAIADHPRNLSDEMLKAMATNGGVVLVNFFNGYLDPAYMKAQKAWFDTWVKMKQAADKESPPRTLDFRQEMKKLRIESPPPETPLSILIDHIEYIIRVAGADHVGLGSDFDGIPDLPTGMEGIDKLPNITYELLKRGHSEETILKVLGGNFMRVFEQATSYARLTRTTVSGDGSTLRLKSDPVVP